jgi:hypothetical protein
MSKFEPLGFRHCKLGSSFQKVLVCISQWSYKKKYISIFIAGWYEKKILKMWWGWISDLYQKYTYPKFGSISPQISSERHCRQLGHIKSDDSHSQGSSDMWQCQPVKIGLVWTVKVIHYWTKWPVGIWAPPLLSMWISCKLDGGSSHSYSFTGLNVHSTSIYLGKHCDDNSPCTTLDYLR